MSLPFEIHDVEEQLNHQLLRDFPGERTGFVLAGDEKYFFPSKFKSQAVDYYNFQLRPDDVWVATFPRSGTTVTQELVWLLLHDCDFEAAAKTPLMQRFPFMEFSILVDPGLQQDVLDLVKGDPEKEEVARNFGENRVYGLNTLPSPRTIKTHLPFSLLPPTLLDTCKVVYMARGPKDVAASYFHHNRLFKTHGYSGDFKTYWNYFEKGLLPHSPFWPHIREAWNLRENKNLLFLFYEDLVKDMGALVRKVAHFLNRDVTEAQVAALVDHLHIDNFRKNPSTNLDAEDLPGLRVAGEQSFIRKGQVGSWSAEFTPELSDRADKWISENLKTIPNFSFPQ